MSFKPGDKIRCINNDGFSELIVNAIYTVDYIIHGDRVVLVEKGHNFDFMPHRFFLVNNKPINKVSVGLDWNDVDNTPIPDNKQNVLAIHKSNRYTSDVYMIWRQSDGAIARWPHESLPITHWAFFNVPK